MNQSRNSSIKEYRRSFLKRLYRNRMLYLLILPSIITVFIFHYIPLYGVQIAFKDFRPSKGIWGSEWVGFKHFIKFISYPYFTKILWNTLKISLAGFLTFPCPIIFALMLNEMKATKLKKICQTITYAPYFVSTVLVCSITILLTGREGLFSIIANLMGRESINWMAQPGAFIPIYTISGLWSGLGWSTIIYLASLSGVSPELVEASRIDGATRLQIIWHVNLPHIKPTIITLFVLSMGGLLSVGFEKVFLLQNDLNREVSSVISTYVYEMGMLKQQYSYSAAIGLFNNIINIIMIVFANFISKKVADIGLW